MKKTSVTSDFFIDDPKANFALFTMMLVTWFLTYNGYTIEPTDIYGHIRAFLLGAGTGSVSFLLWNYALKRIPTITRPWVKGIAVALMLIYCGVLVPLSSQLNATAMVGMDALQKHLDVSLALAEKAYDNSLKRIVAIKGLSAVLRGEVNSLEERKKAESRGGGNTTKPGEGPVYRALEAIQGRLETLQNEAETFNLDIESVSISAQQRLVKLREVISSPADVRVKGNRVASIFNLLRSDLASMDTDAFIISVRTVLSSLGRDITVQTQFSKVKEIEREQRAALNALRADLDAVNEAVGFYLSEITETPSGEIESFERMSAQRATWVYASEFLSVWVGAIAIDTSPMFVILLLVCFMSDLTPAQQAYRKQGGITVEQMRMVDEIRNTDKAKQGRTKKVERLADADEEGLEDE